MPIEHVRFVWLWLAQRRACRDPYLAKGANIQEAERPVALKQNKAGWPDSKLELRRSPRRGSTIEIRTIRYLRRSA